MLSVMVNQDLNAVPTGAPFSPASTRSSPASKPATHTSTSTAPTAASTTTKANSAGNLRPAIALIACAAGAAFF
ncbi:hypothetical protein GQ54DRAFT_298048 [Martensiomyces pterosporus]|nr:hypothetical protein GQ54DRAFT_298048 [Martensiomyces pterosporus]